MPAWLAAAVAAAVVFGVNTVLVKQASGRIADALGAVIIQATCLTAVTLYFLATRAREAGPAWSWGGVAATVGSGVCLGTGLVLLFASFRMGGPLSVVNAVLLSIQLVLATLVGVAVFRESLTGLQLLGMGLCLVGFWLVSRAA